MGLQPFFLILCPKAGPSFYCCLPPTPLFTNHLRAHLKQNAGVPRLPSLLTRFLAVRVTKAPGPLFFSLRKAPPHSPCRRMKGKLHRLLSSGFAQVRHKPGEDSAKEHLPRPAALNSTAFLSNSPAKPFQNHAGLLEITHHVHHSSGCNIASAWPKRRASPQPNLASGHLSACQRKALSGNSTAMASIS